MQIKKQSRKGNGALKKLFACCFMLLTFPICGFSQTWEAGIFGGGAGYVGDLNQRALIKPSGIAAGAFFQRNLNPYLSVKINYDYGVISAADSTSSSQQFRDRNLSFRTTLNELSLMGEFNFMKYTPGALDGRHRFTPYIYLGGGVVKYNPQADYKGQTYNLRPLKTEGESKPYASMAMVFPYGAGVKYNITGSWNLMFNAGYRYTRTDYLDDVSGAYPNPSVFSSSPNPAASKALSDRSGEFFGSTVIGKAGTQRGDLRKYDSYLFIGFTLSFTFLTSNCYY